MVVTNSAATGVGETHFCMLRYGCGGSSRCEKTCLDVPLDEHGAPRSVVSVDENKSRCVFVRVVQYRQCVLYKKVETSDDVEMLTYHLYLRNEGVQIRVRLSHKANHGTSVAATASSTLPQHWSTYIPTP